MVQSSKPRTLHLPTKQSVNGADQIHQRNSVQSGKVPMYDQRGQGFRDMTKMSEISPELMRNAGEAMLKIAHPKKLGGH
jgi:hypothetical protein